MTSNVRIRAFSAIALFVVAGLCISGCDDAADVLSAAMGYTSSVSLSMAERGWDGFPSTPLALVDYIGDLKASISEAKRGGSVGTAGLRGLGADVARPLREEPWEPEPLGKAFGVPTGGSE